MPIISFCIFFFFLNDTPTTEIYPLPLPDALPILHRIGPQGQACSDLTQLVVPLEDGDPHACPLQGPGCGQPTNPATDHAHVQFVLVHQLPSSALDRKSTRLNSSHLVISYAVFCLK